MAPILLEICCGSAEDAIEATAGGAARVELCSALFLGGLTPSLGSLIHVKQEINIPIIAMNRPRPAGFCYSDTEFAVMERDAELLLENGADGIVFGILNEDGTVDRKRSHAIQERIGNRQSVFHRAFDVTPDPFRALEELIDLGFTRVLTSGQRPEAPAGAELIRNLIERAEGRIEVLPGAGITLENVRQFVDATHCEQVHLTAFSEREDRSTLANTSIHFGSANGPEESKYELTDRDYVSRMRKELMEIRRGDPSRAVAQP